MTPPIDRAAGMGDQDPEEREPEPEALVDPETLSDRDQTQADADQTASDSDQSGAEQDQIASSSDQQNAELDQIASDRDQETADHEHAVTPESLGSERAYEANRAERAKAASSRAETAESRAESAMDRAQSATQRDRTAQQRDRHAASRDRDAAAREQAARSQAEALMHTNALDAAAVRSFLAETEELRTQTTSDRERAAADRERAAADREQAAADRLRASLELKRAQLDPLTGVYSRALGCATLRREIDRARRAGEPFALAFVDVDGLKELNDREGHAAGDALIQAVVDALASATRVYDPVVRFGGDEFLCGFTNTEIPAARSRVEELRAAVAARHIGGSISVGVAHLAEGETLEDLIARADADMYAHKANRPQRGRDQRPD